MSTHQCASCVEPAPQGLTICGRCETQTKYALTDQEAHRQELVTTLTRMVRTQAANDGGRGANLALSWSQMGDRFLDTIEGKELTRILATLPPARKAANALHSQRSLLVAWCRLIMEERYPKIIHGPIHHGCGHDSCKVIDWSYGPGNSIGWMSAYLRDHMRILRRHPAAGEFVAEIRAVVKRMTDAYDLPRFRQVHCGPCPDVSCAGQVVATFPTDEQSPIRPVMRCDACRQEWFAEQWAHVGTLIKRREERMAS